MAQFYTIEQAAERLGLTADAFRRKLATEWKNTPKRFPDGATLRFQVREIDDLARTLGRGSEADVQAPDAPLQLADSSEELLSLAGDEDVLGEVGRGKSKPSSSGKLPKSPSDSDVKLEATGGKVKPKRSSELPTEEIDIDAEQAAKGPKSPVKRTAKYEVTSDPDVQIKPPSKAVEAGSEFELSLAPDSSDEFDLKLTEDDSDEVEIGAMPRGGLKGGDSGINLQAPADSGISLEKSSSSEFELQMQGDEAKPKSKPKKPSTDKLPPAAKQKTDDSSSEFELTLDDSGEAAAVSDATTAYEEEQKDIFETDFELPALDEESGSEGLAVEGADTDVESSDFDLALDETDAAEEEASASEVVAIDEEEPRRGKARRLAGDEELDELEAADDVDLEEDEEDLRPARAAAPTTWGALPAIFLLPCVLIMFLAGIMGYELLHSMWGYQQPYQPTGGLVRFIAESVGEKLPTD